MTRCFFVSDLHGQSERYQKLFSAIKEERPETVFLGGDLFPSGLMALSTLDFAHRDFVQEVLVRGFARLKRELQKAYPRVYLILGNDDGRFEEAAILDAASRNIWHYAHNRRFALKRYAIYGYAYVPPSPFQLKDWERYDVSRYVDPGCVSPEKGFRSFPVAPQEVKYATIAKDLSRLAGEDDLSRAVFLFHAPPHDTKLDRAALDGKMVDHVPLDVHVGSIAIRRFVEDRQPWLTLHGHVHESARLTGAWKDRIGNTVLLSAAHDGPELALVRFDLDQPARATRELL